MVSNSGVRSLLEGVVNCSHLIIIISVDLLIYRFMRYPKKIFNKIQN